MCGSQEMATGSPNRSWALRRARSSISVRPSRIELSKSVMVHEGGGSVKKQEVRARIEEIGIIPAVRTSSAADARFAAETVSRGGIPVAEITVTVPEAMKVITGLTSSFPEMIVGAGTVLDVETAQRCLDAGAKFLTSPVLVLAVVEFAAQNDVAVCSCAFAPP